jgi:hypothetical protein
MRPLLLAGICGLLVASVAAQAAERVRDLPPAVYAPETSEMSRPEPAAAASQLPGSDVPEPQVQPQVQPQAEQPPVIADAAAGSDYRAFCTQPDVNGAPRTAAWVETCLAAAMPPERTADSQPPSQSQSTEPAETPSR